MTKTNTRSRIVSILLVLVMLLTMVPITAVTANAAEPKWETVTTYEQFAEAMTANAPRNVRLGADIDTAALNSGIGLLNTLTVKGRKQLDLNGHTLRLFTNKAGLGNLIMIQTSSLTLSDSSTAKTGRILGVTSTDSNVLISVWQNGKFTMNSGKLEVEAGNFRKVLWRRTIDCRYGGEAVINGGTLYVPPETYERYENQLLDQFLDEFDDLHNGSCGYTLIADNECKVTITGGTFQGLVRMNASNSKWNGTTSRVIITGGTFENNVVLNGAGSKAGDGKVTLAEIKGGTFLGKVQAWAAASFESSFSTPEVVISGGDFSKEFWLRPKFPLVNDKEQEGMAYQVAAKLDGGTFHEGFSADKDSGNYVYSGAAVKQRLEAYEIYQLADKLLGQNAIQTGNGTFAAQDNNSYNKYITNYRKSEHDSGGYAFIIKAVNNQPTTIIPNAWGMKSVTLDGNPINYFKDWKGTVENLNNDEAHTLKFEWYPLAQELKDAGYTYRANFDCYTVDSNTPTTSVPISATATEYSYTIPAGAAPSVYPFDLQLNLDKNGSSVGIVSNQHIVKLVVSEAPVAPPSLTGQVYYTSGIVYGSPISISASVTPAEATKSYQWQRSTDGGSTWTNIEGATSGKYTPVAADVGENVRIRVKVTAEGYLGEIVGAALKVSKAANNNYPEVIKLEAVKNGAGNYTGFKITNFDSDYEYVYSTTDTPNWSANQISSATVTGLTSNTTYYVFARFKETNTHTAGSIVSKNSIMLYDYVPLDRVSLEGYDSGNTIYIKKGESVTLKVSADPSNANSWKEITFKDSSVSSLGTSNITISNEKIAASGTTATAFPNDHSITITGVSKGSATLDASYSGPTQPYYGRWYVVVYDDSTVANALRLESVYAYADITLSENEEAKLPTDLPTLLPANSGYHLEWRILKRGTYGATYVTENDNIKLEDGKIKPKAAHAASEKAQLELVAVKDGSTEYKTLPKKSLFYVTVTEAPVIELTGITVAPTKVNLELNATYQLSAVKEPVNAAGSLNWESSNTSVATVDSTGKVTAKAQGTATITVSCGDKKATCTVTVDHQHDYSGQPYLYLDPGNHYQECKAGDGYNIQAHEFSAWTDNGDGTHSRHCTVCKMTDGSTYTETAEHTWVWVVDQEAALNQPGKQHEECTGCHAKRNENTEIPALRDYAVTVTGGTATVAAGTTITRAMEGVEVTVTAQAPGGKHFVKWVVKAGGVTLANETSATTTFTMPANDVTIEAEFAENPVEAYTLTVIKGTASVAAGTPITDKIEQNTVVTITADAPETGKVFDKWVVLEGNVTLADATKATTTFTMPASAVKIEATYKDAPPSHTHSYGTDWKYDDNNHWHECACGDKADIAAHSASEWIVDTAATETADGSKHKECTVCKKVLETATIPATGSTHTHSYGTDWKYDGTNHWHECACGDKADTAAHSFQWVIDKAATKEATGIKHEACTVCGAKRSENTVIDKLPDGGNTGNTGSGDNNTDKPGKDDSTKSPQTGDSSNLIGWLAALFVSGGVLTLLGINGKKRKESEAE